VRPSAKRHGKAPRGIRAIPSFRSPIIKWLAIAGLCSLLVFLAYYPGDIPFLPTQRGDSELIQQMMENSSSTVGSYAATAIIYRLIGEYIDIRLFICIFGVLSLVLTLRRADRLGDIFICSIFAGVAVLTELSLSSKDVFVSGLALASIYLIYKRKVPLLISLALVGVLYASYGLFVRSYYFLIFFFAMFVLSMNLVPKNLRLMAFVFAFVVFVIIAQGPLIEAQDRRDYVNDVRQAYFAAEGSRTAFYNYVYATGVIEFFKNYAYAMARLTMPLFWNPSVKDLVFFVFSLASLATAFILARRKSPESKAASALIVGQMMVCWIFEPDLGSYARHLSSIFPYTAALWMFRDPRPQVSLRRTAQPRAPEPAHLRHTPA